MKFSLEIVAKDGKVKFNLPDGRTLGISPTSDGAQFTPDWYDGDRHFTLGEENEDSVTKTALFFHITDDRYDEKVASDYYSSENELMFDMYSAMGGFGQLKPANWVNDDFLWDFDPGAYAERLEDVGVMERSEDWLWISFTQLEDYLKHLVKNGDELVEFLGYVYDPVDRQEAWEGDSRFFSRLGSRGLCFSGRMDMSWSCLWGILSMCSNGCGVLGHSTSCIRCSKIQCFPPD